MSTLAVYRDDGPLLRALGARRLALPGPALAAAAAVLLGVAIAAAGDEASDAVAVAVVAAVVVLGALASASRERGGFRWAVPPLIRLTEYAALLWIGALAGALPAAFALIAALAFRHYDLVYRLRHRGVTPPAWVDAAGLGWEGRLALALVLLLAGALPAGFFVLAGVLGAVFVAESIVGWTATVELRTGVYEEQEDEGQ